MAKDQFGVRNLGTKIWLSENIGKITVTEKRTVIQCRLKTHIMLLQIKKWCILNPNSCAYLIFFSTLGSELKKYYFYYIEDETTDNEINKEWKVYIRLIWLLNFFIPEVLLCTFPRYKHFYWFSLDQQRKKRIHHNRQLRFARPDTSQKQMILKFL